MSAKANSAAKGSGPSDKLDRFDRPKGYNQHEQAGQKQPGNLQNENKSITSKIRWLPEGQAGPQTHANQ
ncbi:hypothetical protein GCM10027567_31810 [Spongiibacter taiwanensis]